MISTRYLGLYSKQIESRLGGKSIQIWMRCWRFKAGLGWVTRYIGVPKIFMCKCGTENGCPFIELHFWRIRVGVKLIST